MKNHKKLVESVVGMLSSYFNSENIYKPKIIRDQYILGRTMKNHVDIYLEFIQMNNVERTIINVVSSREATTEDVLRLSNTLNDLEFKAKGVLYYDSCISNEALIVSKHKIETVKFVLQNEIIKSLRKAIEVLLPDESTIGDPFWVVMETDERGKNTGTYHCCEGRVIPLYLSRRQAQKIAESMEDNHKVYGLSQVHLKSLLNMANLDDFQLGLIYPRFGLLKPALIIAPGNDNILKWYFRENEYV